jgi:hypothetical protein
MTGRIFRTIATNWIHIVGFYLTTYLTLVVASFFDPTEGWEPIILTGFMAALLLFVIYGYVVIAWFYLAIVIMDVVCFTWTNERRLEILMAEWIIISSPFIYWAFEYEYWLWIALSVSLLITQIVRLGRIKKIEGNDRRNNIGGPSGRASDQKG